MVARTRGEVLAARGVKPSLSPNLSVLATVEALDVKRLLFIGVGCQVCPVGGRAGGRRRAAVLPSPQGELPAGQLHPSRPPPPTHTQPRPNVA